jgi:hypothetical protein
MGAADSLVVVVTDSITRTVADTAAVAADSVDWVQECAYRQAMLIDRIDFWMNLFAGMFWTVMIIAFIYTTVSSIGKWAKARKARKRLKTDDNNNNN